MTRRPALLVSLALASVFACGDGTPPSSPQQTHSGPIATAPDGSRLYVVHPDADCVSILDRTTHAIVHERLLAAKVPAVDAATQRYDPAVSPRALALDSKGATLYVTGERSGHALRDRRGFRSSRGRRRGLLRANRRSREPRRRTRLRGVLARRRHRRGGRAPHPGEVRDEATVPCPRKPWSLAWGADGKTLFATHLLGPGVSVFATQPLSLETTWAVADGPPSGDGDPTEPHGEVRGLYDAAVRPGSKELWVAHLMLGTDTAQPTLDFLRTVFPALSIFDDAGAQVARSRSRQTPAIRARSATWSPVRARLPSPTMATSRSSSTPTARTCSWSTPRNASRRRSCGPSPGTCPRAWCGRTASSTCRSATARTSQPSA